VALYEKPSTFVREKAETMEIYIHVSIRDIRRNQSLLVKMMEDIREDVK
jgi:hypothetical protein